MNTIDIKELRELFGNLLNILEKYGDNTVINQKRIIKNIILLVDCKSDYSEKISEIHKEYAKLYPAHGGLSEFNIWAEDCDERRTINEPLDTIRKRLWDIFQRVL